MRTLHLVASKAFGGAERWMHRLALALAERGVEVEVGVRRASQPAAADWRALRCHQLAMRTNWDPLSRREIGRLVDTLAPDIVQTYMGRATQLTRARPAHRFVHVARLGGYYKLHKYRHAHAWIGNTKGICDYLTAGGFPPQRVFHIYNFIEVPAPSGADPLALREELGIAPEAWVLLTAGRFVPFKGHRYLLEALAALPAEVGGRPVVAVLVGDGRLAPELRRQAQAAGVAQRVRWTGWQDDTRRYYEAADLVVVPSREIEPFANVVLEAWSHRKPLLVTGFRGAREYINDEVDALRVPVDDPAALARGIQRLLTERAHAEAMAVAGFGRIAHEFSKEAVLQAYLRVYRRLLGDA